VAAWLRHNTITGPAPEATEIAALKGELGTSVRVCLPALNEAPTIGAICRTIGSELMGDRGVVDQLIVVDSGSEDATRELAAEAGAEVHLASDLLAGKVQGDRVAGKGEALWKSLAVATGDLIVWIDSDIRNFTPDFVTTLVHPLLERPDIAMTKAFYDRPLETSEGSDPKGGARVTELAARPLLGLLYPRLAGVIQPLSGEYALRRDLAMELPFVTGYGVDVGLLIDVVERHGLQSLVQVDVDMRQHRNRDLAALGRMSFQVMQAILKRLSAAGHLRVDDSLSTHMIQFIENDAPAHIDLDVVELPPMSEVLAAL
jgi:glucosyl-3-phosphoglycerate synthase